MSEERGGLYQYFLGTPDYHRELLVVSEAHRQANPGKKMDDEELINEASLRLARRRVEQLFLKHPIEVFEALLPLMPEHSDIASVKEV